MIFWHTSAVFTCKKMSQENRYNHKIVEPKWQKFWEEEKTFRAEIDETKEKYYVLDMFPFPSGAGLHVGHPEGYTATDIISRYKRANGKNVLHPMGWDAFGLPAENYAIKMGVHPEISTKKNISNFTRQVKSLGFSYDWDREFSTTDVNYYKWTQWIFLQMYKKGLLYEKKMPMNWCPKCRIVAANEEVEQGKHERCGAEVERRNLRQWMFEITKYADRLLKDLHAPNVVMIHGWEGAGEAGWFGELKKTLTEKGVEVHSPDFPNTNNPQYQEWKSFFEAELLPKISENTILLGHSLGCGFLQKYASENTLKVSDFVFVSPTVSDCGVNEIKNFFMEKFDYEKIKNSADNIWIYGGGKDPYISKDEFLFLQEKTGAHLCFEEDKGHYGQAQDKKPKKVFDWFEKIIEGILEWPEKIKAMQKNWIGKSTGCNVDWKVDGHDVTLSTFTTTVDTIYGVTFAVISPEHPELSNIIAKENKDDVNLYCRESRNKSDMERTELQKDKTGVFTGAYIIHPFSRKKIPLFVADYVLMSYGTGVVMGVPAHDQRDQDFAKKYNIPIIQSVILESGESFVYDDVDKYSVKGKIINSENFTGLHILEGREQIIEALEERKMGKRKIHYKLRDWIFTRQRYWGEPIPLVHCEKCGVVPLPERELPLELPKEVESFLPTEDGQSPLAKVEEWVNTTCPKCGGAAKRETSTMPNWAGSNWYWLRFMDAKNDKEAWSPEAEKYWGPVDLYVGGAEHAVLHLLYSRFWHKVFYDLELVHTKEPFKKLMNQGLILAEDGQKMSKSLGNVVNPDEIVEQYGADTLRMYEMFMGPFEQSKVWNTGAVEGMYKFLQKIWRLFTEKGLQDECLLDESFMRLTHKTVKKVSTDIEEFKFNTAISQMMIWVNAAQKLEKIPRVAASRFIRLLAPFAPHLAEEIWKEVFKNEETISYFRWPTFDENLAKDDEIQLAVQVNGKLRATLSVATDIAKDDALTQAKANENVQKFLEGGKIVKEIFVPGKIVNFVIK